MGTELVLVSGYQAGGGVSVEGCEEGAWGGAEGGVGGTGKGSSLGNEGWRFLPRY